MTSPPPPTSTADDDDDDVDDWTAGDSPITRETEDGVDYLVIPANAQKEGVYRDPTENGVSREFAPGSELTNDLDGWESSPLTLRHPTVNVDGQAKYGLTTGPQSRYTTVGEFRDSDRSDEETLRGRVWIREDQVGKHGGDLEGYLEDVRNNTYGDVSPGYHSQGVTEYGSYDGQSYQRRQTNIRPDHVAILPDEPGNCSIADGCGVGRVNARPGEPAPLVRVNAAPAHDDSSMTPPPTSTSTARTNIRTDARVPEYDGIVPSAAVDEDAHLYWSLEDYLNAYQDEDGVVDGNPYSPLSAIPDDAAEWIAQHTLLGSIDAESEENLLMFPVVSPDGQLYEDKLLEVLGTEGSWETIPEDQRDSAREVARDLLADEFGREIEDRTNTSSSRVAGAFATLAQAINLDVSSLARINADTADNPVAGAGDDTETATDGGSDSSTESNEAAESAVDADTTMLPERTQTLVNEHGFDAENLPDEDEECFDRIYDQFVGGEGTDASGEDADTTTTDADTTDVDADDTEGETTDSPESSTDDGVEIGEDQAVVNLGEHDSLDDLVVSRVNKALKDQKSSAERKKNERAIVNSSAPFDEEDLEGMNDAAVEAIAESHDVHAETDQSGGSGASFAGVPSPRTNVDETGGEEAPVGGYGNSRGGDDGGD